jgi:putative glutamine amidotransferase
MIGVHFGASLVAHVDRHRERNGPIDEHRITAAPGSFLASIAGAGPFRVNSRHHQAIRDLPTPLRATVRVGGLIEAFEAPEHRLLAVQWHPETRPDEALDTGPADALFREFVAAAKTRAAAR